MDIYKIGVRIALANEMSPVLQMIGRDLTGIHTKVGEVEKGFGRWGLAIGGVAGIMGGTAILGGLFAIAKAGGEVNNQLELMKGAGIQLADVQKAAATAMKVSSDVLTSSYVDNLRHIRELNYAFGNADAAMKFLEPVTKANAMLSAVAGVDKDQVWQFVKSLEGKNAISDPAKFSSYLDQMSKVVVATGGKVTPAMFFSAFKYGRTATLGWDETFATKYLPRLMMDWSGGGGSGAGGPGNALMSLFNEVVSGHMTKSAALVWAKLGLATVTQIPGSSQVLTRVRPDVVAAMVHNPYDFAQVVAPYIAAAAGKDQIKMLQVMGAMAPNRTAGAVLAQMVLQGKYMMGDKSLFEKEGRMIDQAMAPAAGYSMLISENFDTIMKALQVQQKNLRDVVGAPLSAPGGPLVMALAGITTLLNQLAVVAQAHPQAIVIVADALAGLATAMIIGGLVALGSALFALAGTGAILIGLAAGLAAFAAVGWPELEKIADGLEGWAKRNGLYQFDKGVSDSVDGWMRTHLPALAPLMGPNPATAAPGPTGLNAIPPPSGKQTVQVSSVINMDGRKVADAVTQHQVDALSGPSKGSPYPDPTWATAPVDLVLAR